MMNAVMTVENTEMQIREYNGQRVVTFKDIDMVHRRKTGTARKNFTNNKKHFIKDEDYFEISREDVGENFSPTYGFSEKAPSGILITETGYLMLVKSFRDDLSWDVQRKLVNSYFRQRETVKKEQEELSDIPKSPLLEKDRDWFRTRKPKIRQVCDAYEVTKREFMHHAVMMYYVTPDALRNAIGGYKKAKYSVSVDKNSNFYSWQYDNENGTSPDGKKQDGYAGAYGKSIDGLYLCIV